MSSIPTIQHTGGETAHTFKFWCVDAATGTRVPISLQLDSSFNAVQMSIDPQRSVQSDYKKVAGAIHAPQAAARNVVVTQNGVSTVVSVSPEKIEAHSKLCSGKILENPAEEAVRLRYVVAIAAAMEDASCSDCSRGAITRKYQNLMLEVFGALATS